ncbi:hypothetical protein J5N97_013577 [Dioscorea zingiberensis]|uniref:EF-hand domain-containing protein n=1 Tax=Dioscorea zingiberensis TaxID=325984 RepID=A0A9D5CRG3_9LILI|nr:hypothetical protein J5N97_013577 [Dioscorea zingiberensis]
MYLLNNMVHSFMKFHCSSIRNLVFSVKKQLKTSKVEEGEANECKTSFKAYEGYISSEDAEKVVEKLGIMRMKESTDQEYSEELVDAAYELLEEKEASIGELAAAFAVFDEDGDGMVSERDLWRVFQRLGLEGMVRREEEYMEMINAYDGDGDGRINLHEFKCMLERAT